MRRHSIHKPNAELFVPNKNGALVTALKTIELKAFIPAKDFALSKQFYQDIGFTLASDEDGIAYFHHGNVSFLLQDFYVKELAENLMMHLLVEDVGAWWARLKTSGVADKYSVKLGEIKQQPWRMRDFTLHDPSGVLWYFAQNTD
jgi:catechol 2,3-dioxygenase-like lactoylglutathione lyase family enzyme